MELTCTQSRYTADTVTMYGGDIQGQSARFQPYQASLTGRKHVAKTKRIDDSKNMGNVGVVIIGQDKVHLIAIGSAEALRSNRLRDHAMPLASIRPACNSCPALLITDVRIAMQLYASFESPECHSSMPLCQKPSSVFCTQHHHSKAVLPIFHVFSQPQRSCQWLRQTSVVTFGRHVATD